MAQDEADWLKQKHLEMPDQQEEWLARELDRSPN